VTVDVPRARYRFTGTYRFTPRLQAGFEYNPIAGEVGLIGNYIVNPESEKWPMISFGTSSDRIGTPPGPKAYFVTFAKGFPTYQTSAYVSLNYSEFERGFNFPFGITHQIDPRHSLLFMNDGRKSHLLFTHMQASWSVSAMLIWMKHPGISISFGF